ncbi:hypothetical protein [Cylindrospermopsis raciborskii]|uniref:hypothetical protein n=1 Tax=Cylindrospermopsis raciborskii TaxID=77022 RepID=UPI001177C8DC|nr:hypothetical protein [Cylindrospermopsis raciborskii]
MSRVVRAKEKLERLLTPTTTRGELWMVAIAGLVLSTIAWSPTIFLYPNTGGGDGQYFQQMFDAGKVSLRRYHELPLWNAYQCGGLPLWDNPQSVVGSPIALAMTFANATSTVIVWYVLHGAIGFMGTWLLARLDLGLGRYASFAAAAMYAFGVSHACQYGGGHTPLAPFIFLPLCLYLWRKAETSYEHAVGLGLVYALTFYNGGVYPLGFVSLVVACETLTRMWPVPRAGRVVRAGVVAGLVFVTVSAARLVPVVDQLAHHKRALEPEIDFISWQTLKDMYLDRTHAWHPVGQTYVWPEYSTYTGILGVSLALLGILHLRRKEAWLFAVAAVTFLLMLGHFASWAPWSFLKANVFPYKSMRVPSRFRLLESAFVAFFVGYAIDRAPATFAKILRKPTALRQARLAVSCLALIGIGDIFGTASSVVASKFDGPPETRVVASTRLYVDNESANFEDQPRQNRARLACWDEWNFTMGAPLWYGDVPQARAVDPGAVVEVANRTQNSFTLDVDVKREGAEVLVNGAWDRGWRTSVGRIFERNKQIVLSLPQGRHRVRVHYWPVGLTAGLVTTGLSLVAVALFFARGRLFGKPVAEEAAGASASTASTTPEDTSDESASNDEPSEATPREASSDAKVEAHEPSTETSSEPLEIPKPEPSKPRSPSTLADSPDAKKRES